MAFNFAAAAAPNVVAGQNANIPINFLNFLNLIGRGSALDCPTLPAQLLFRVRFGVASTAGAGEQTFGPFDLGEGFSKRSIDVPLDPQTAGELVVSITGEVSFTDDDLVLSQTQELVVCVVPAAGAVARSGEPLPLISLYPIDPEDGIDLAHPGDQTQTIYRITNNGEAISVMIVAQSHNVAGPATTENASADPERGGFGVADPVGDAFPVRLTDVTAGTAGTNECIPLPAEGHHLLLTAEDALTLDLEADETRLISVEARSFQLCTDGSCNQIASRVLPTEGGEENSSVSARLQNPLACAQTTAGASTFEFPTFGCPNSGSALPGTFGSCVFPTLGGAGFIHSGNGPIGPPWQVTFCANSADALLMVDDTPVEGFEFSGGAQGLDGQLVRGIFEFSKTSGSGIPPKAPVTVQFNTRAGDPAGNVIVDGWHAQVQIGAPTGWADLFPFELNKSFVFTPGATAGGSPGKNVVLDSLSQTHVWMRQEGGAPQLALIQDYAVSCDERDTCKLELTVELPNPQNDNSIDRIMLVRDHRGFAAPNTLPPRAPRTVERLVDNTALVPPDNIDSFDGFFDVSQCPDAVAFLGLFPDGEGVYQSLVPPAQSGFQELAGPVILPLVDTNDTVPGTTGVPFEFLFGVSYNGRFLAFAGFGQDFENLGIYGRELELLQLNSASGQNGGILPLVTDNETLNMGIGTPQSPGLPSVNRRPIAQAAATAGAERAVVTVFGTEGIGILAVNVNDPADKLLVANQSTPVPGTKEFFGGFGDPVIAGQLVAFPGFADSSAGIHLADLSGANVAGIPLTTIVDTSTPIPGGTGTFTGFGFTVGFDGVDAGFHGTGESTQEGVYRTVGGALTGSLVKLADRNTSVPGGVGTFSGFFAVVPVDGVNAVFSGRGPFGNAGAYLATMPSAALSGESNAASGVSEPVLRKLIANGDTFDGKTVLGFSLGREALMGDTVALSVLFTDDSEGIYLIAPALHGDADGNGVRDLRDVAGLLNCFSGQGTTASFDCRKGFEVDGDGDVDNVDYLLAFHTAPTRLNGPLP